MFPRRVRKMAERSHRRDQQAQPGKSQSQREKPQSQSDAGPHAHGEPRPQMQSEPKPPFPAEKQEPPGLESQMRPRPRYQAERYKAAGKLAGKRALITGGDSGIGRAVAVLYAREGADVAITYLPVEQEDADETRAAVEAEGRRCVLIAGDLAQRDFCRECVERTVRELGGLDILVSNAAYQARKHDVMEIDPQDWLHTFDVNIHAYFYLVQAALPHLKPGASILVTSSVVGVEGSKALLDYGATKGAINQFTRGLAQQLADKGIRVNAVAPGPVWTPLNPSDPGQSPEAVSKFGSDVPLKRPAQPEEIAPSYVFLASDADSSYITGTVLQQFGGETMPG